MKQRPVSQPVVTQMLGMPLQFEANHGQVDGQVKFISRGSGYTLFLTPTESVMVLQQREAKEQPNDIHNPLSTTEPAPIKQSVVRMKLEGANPSPAVTGMEQLPGIVNYFIGNDPAKWRTKIPTYAKVQYQEAYPGIDLAYYGNQGKLEYDFIVAPGADPNQIKLAFEGASDIKVAASGDLLLTTALGEVRLQKPVVYQLEKDGHKTLVAGNYVLFPGSSAPYASRAMNHGVGIQLAQYDNSKTVVIDPVLDYATYLGGTGNEDTPDIAVDPTGNAYVAGITNSVSFPVTAGAYDRTFNDVGSNPDFFVAKVSPTGSTLLYATYLGGSRLEGFSAFVRIAVDSAGQAYLASASQSTDYPVTPGAFQTALHVCPPPDDVTNCTMDAVVSKLDATGSALLYSTYLGGSRSDFASDIVVDTAGNAYVPVRGLSSDFPTTPGVYDPACQFSGITKLNPTGTGLVWSTCLSASGSSSHQTFSAAIDSAGNVIVVGQTLGSTMPIVNAAQPLYGGGTQDAFVWKLNSSGSALLFATFLGGTGFDQASSVAVDAADNIYVTGPTDSPNFPVSPGALDTSHNGGRDIFVTKLSSNGTILYSTYLGGSGDEPFNLSDISVDSVGQAYIAADTQSANFPTINPIDSTLGGFADAVFSVLKADGSGLAFSTYLGGSLGGGFTGQDVRVRMATLPSGVSFLTGLTSSINFPVTAGVFQPTYSGGASDLFVVRISNKPTANAGTDQSVPEGTLVTLDGSSSTGASLTYIWTQVSGPGVALSGATTVHPTFAAPHVPAAGGTVTFELVVCEGTSSNCSDPDTVNVHITNINQIPVAQAGPDQTVQEGSPVLLDGSASYDPDIELLTYTWLQLYGPPVTLVYPNTATPSFTAPAVGSGGAQVDFELIVTDPRGLNHSDFVSVRITNVNQPPAANAGSDQTKNEQTLVTLDGSGSLDPDLDMLSFSWSQTGGAFVPLSGANTVSPTFIAPDVSAGGAVLTFQLVVHDGHVGSVADTVQIAVVNVNDPPVCTLAQASPNLLWPPNHTMTQVSIVGLADPNNQTLTITYPKVTQDEPINGLGDGDTTPDAAVSGNQILLRAERAGTGNGRVYEVHFTATDPEGASCSGKVKVSVPHNKKDPAIEGPQLYNSFGP
jgi:hypothetical protein